MKPDMSKNKYKNELTIKIHYKRSVKLKVILIILNISETDITLLLIL